MKFVGLDEQTCPDCFLPLSPEQCRAARAWLSMSQDGLAKAANISISAVRDFETGRRVPTINDLAAIQSALTTAGIEFVIGEKCFGIAQIRL